MTWHDTSYHPIPPHLTPPHLIPPNVHFLHLLLLLSSYLSLLLSLSLHRSPYHDISPPRIFYWDSPSQLTPPIPHHYNTTHDTLLHCSTLYYTTTIHYTPHSCLFLDHPSLYLTPRPLPHSIRHDTINPISYQIDEIISNQLKWNEGYWRK